MIRVLLLHQKEVFIKTGFTLAVFSRTVKVVFAEQRARFAGGVSGRIKGLVPQYGPC